MKNFKIIFILIVFFIGCKENNAQQETKDLYFNVDHTLLNTCYIDSSLKFSFCPPIGWNPLPEEMLDEIKLKLNEILLPTEDMEYQLIQFFTDDTSGSFCSLTNVSHSKSGVTLFYREETYEKSLGRQFPQAQINKGRFKIKHLEVEQFLILTDGKVIFKLMFTLPTQVTLQIDYIIARRIYPNIIKQIESSIGSISSFH